MTDEIMMPVPKAEAVSLAEIHAMRQLTDAVSTLARQMERYGEKLDDVRERIIRIEAKNHERAIEAIQTELKIAQSKIATFDGLQKKLDDALAKIDGLESVRDKATGAVGASGWLAKYAPWILTIAALALAGLGFDQAKP